MKNILGLLGALAVAAALTIVGAYKAYTAPEVNTWGYASKVIYSDTLGMLASDSVAVTDSLSVFGARTIYLVVSSAGAAGTGAFNGGTGIGFDSLAVPILQSRFPNGSWVGTGGASYLPPANLSPTVVLTATSLVSNVPRFALGHHSELSGGGTPIPLVNDYFRWRLKSTNARRYATASLATLAPTGRITITAYVWR